MVVYPPEEEEDEVFKMVDEEEELYRQDPLAPHHQPGKTRHDFLLFVLQTYSV